MNVRILSLRELKLALKVSNCWIKLIPLSYGSWKEGIFKEVVPDIH